MPFDSLCKKKIFKDVEKTIKCISGRLGYAFQEKYYEIQEEFILDAAYLSFGKGIFMIRKDIGYID